MNKMKEYAMITVAALAFMLITGVAKADAPTRSRRSDRRCPHTSPTR